jgi:hypothetical protein
MTSFLSLRRCVKAQTVGSSLFRSKVETLAGQRSESYATEVSVFGIQPTYLKEVATVGGIKRFLEVFASLAGRPGLNRRANQNSHEK